MLNDSKLVTSYVGLVEIIIDSIQPLKQYPRSLSDRKEELRASQTAEDGRPGL